MRIVLVMVGLMGAAALAQAPATFQPVGNMSQLMIDIIYPTSDAIFYVDRNPPKNEHDWDVLRAQALTLAESGNLLLMEGRARDREAWAKDAKAMIDVATTAFRAAQVKDIAAIRALNDPLNDACVICHEQYRPGYRRRPRAVTQ